MKTSNEVKMIRKSLKEMGFSDCGNGLCYVGVTYFYGGVIKINGEEYLICVLVNNVDLVVDYYDKNEFLIDGVEYDVSTYFSHCNNDKECLSMLRLVIQDSKEVIENEL